MSTENDISSALPDYLVERELGKGGMGLVFLGRHVRLGRLVAIKELPPTFATDPSVRERFSTEARTLATLSHPHIVPIYDYVEREGLCLIVMEELPGGTVWDRFTSTGLTPPTACAVVLACCAALQHAHDNGVLHLDVKPDNLMFSRDAAIKVTDFGISRVLSGDETLGTLDGQVLGTPAYMSPEQARGSELTPASDVYSAGVMLYELLSGHLPWTGAETATDLLLKRLREDPRPLTAIAPQIPVPLADVVMKAIEREPENRHASAEDFGVAVASACADAWGPDWLDLAGVTIIGSDRLSLAARTTRQQSAVTDTGETPRISTTASSAPQTVVGTVLDGENRIAPETTATPAGGPTPAGTASPPKPIGVGTAPGATTPPTAAAPLEFQVVRAAGSAPRIEGANLKEIDRSAFVDVAETLGQRHRSGRLFALALLFVIGAVVTAGVLFAPPKNSGTLHRRDVRIAGFDVSRGRASFDFGKNLPIRVSNPSLALRTDRATLALSTAGVSLGTVSTPIANGSGVFKTGIQKYISAGSVNAQLELQSRSKRIAVQKFSVTARSKWYLTALGLGGLILLLGGFAYFEGALRPLRRGRRRISSLVSCAISAAVMGLGVAAFASALGHADPTAAGLAAAALFSGIAGVFFGLAVRRRALRKGVHRAVKRAQTVAGVGN